jgi:hypothetical protein
MLGGVVVKHFKINLTHVLIFYWSKLDIQHAI